MYYIIIAILLILLVVLAFMYWRLNHKYQELLQTTKLRESIVDNKVIQISNIEDTMEHNKSLLIQERARIDEQLAEMAKAEEEAAAKAEAKAAEKAEKEAVAKAEAEAAEQAANDVQTLQNQADSAENELDAEMEHTDSVVPKQAATSLQTDDAIQDLVDSQTVATTDTTPTESESQPMQKLADQIDKDKLHEDVQPS
ncbi:membrane protein involved in colicin uptake [Weissella uvarum]|uniref:hypothetical protein n=1 Tax=Weissella uvarum TaxID=1479233 RepID=UPI00195FE65F|nr:hypothetical protein [Weissella uvarum]MBM7617506.1 membrane protein involved in colicin uptake [Weissella uvarum]MCM0595610.1 hypothetical protein [Weissella uvarum]